MIKIEERSFKGQTYRPMPEVFVSEAQDLAIIATPWGQRSSAKKAIETIDRYLISARQDVETTSPFTILECLSPLQNSLRIAVKLANDALHQGDNKEEYTSGIELLAVAITQTEIAWCQIGQPAPYLKRGHQSLCALGPQLDASTELSSKVDTPPPLPNSFLGTEATSDFSVQSIRRLPGDKLLILSRSLTPKNLFLIDNDHFNFKNLSQAISTEDNKQPFWLGLLSI